MTGTQRLVLALVFVLALAGGVGIGVVLLGGQGGSGPSGSPLAQASAGGSQAAPPTPTASAPARSASPSASPTSTPAATPSPTPTPKPTPQQGEPATIVITALKLDAADDPEGLNRKLAFRSQGAGPITVSLKTLTPQGTARMCLSADGKRLGCTVTADGRLTARTTKPQAEFVVTLRGTAIATPVVDVTVTFPARTPSLQVHNARFDGTAFPETNGLQALVTVRRDGDLGLEADWGGHPFLYEVDLLQQDGPGSQVLPNQGPATRASVSLPVTTGTWKLVLQNIEDGMGITLLDATIAWP